MVSQAIGACTEKDADPTGGRGGQGFQHLLHRRPAEALSKGKVELPLSRRSLPQEPDRYCDLSVSDLRRQTTYDLRNRLEVRWRCTDAPRLHGDRRRQWK